MSVPHFFHTKLMIMVQHGKTLASYLHETLRQGQPDLHDWHIMHESINEWMGEEADSMAAWMTKLEQEEDPTSKKKAYKAKLRKQNYQAAAQFNSRIYAALLNDRKKIHAMLHTIKQLDRIRLQNERAMVTFRMAMNSLIEENEVLLAGYLKLMEQTVPMTQQEYEQRLMDKLRTDDGFRSRVELLFKNDITGL